MGRKRHAKKVQNSEHLENADEVTVCKTSDVFGRYLEAKKDIKKGTIILSEKYLIAGPLRSSDSVCLGCHVGIDVNDSKKTAKCTRCTWPMCSSTCVEKEFHKQECKFFVEKNIQFPYAWRLDYGLITVLRGLLLKINNPSSWAQLIALQHHNETRKLLPLWKENQENIVQVICDKWKLKDLFSEEEVHSVCGILEVNAFEMGETFSYRGIFPRSAMLAHDCIPNVTQFENSKDGIIELRASVDIPTGSPLLLSYAFCLQPTPSRRKMLQDTKFFTCACRRCSDPTELGTHLNTMICQSCKIGFSMENSEQVRSCNKCSNRIKCEEVEKIIWKFGLQSQGLGNILSMEGFLRECAPIFHPTHFIPFGVKFNLCQAYGRQSVNLENLTPKDLERKAEICSEVLRILDVICPGYNITRGLVLYECQAAESTLAKRIFESGKYNKPLLKRKLENILKVLLESITILKYSHPSTYEYKMGQAAEEDSLVALRHWISILK